MDLRKMRDISTGPMASYVALVQSTIGVLFLLLEGFQFTIVGLDRIWSVLGQLKDHYSAQILAQT